MPELRPARRRPLGDRAGQLARLAVPAVWFAEPKLASEKIKAAMAVKDCLLSIMSISLILRRIAQGSGGHGRESLQCINDIIARMARNAPKTLRKSVAFGTVGGLSDLPIGQTASNTVNAFAGKMAINMPARIMKTKNAVIAGVGELGSAPVTGGGRRRPLVQSVADKYRR